MSTTDIQMVNLIVGWFLGQGAPYLIDLVNRYIPTSKVRLWVSVLLCLVIGGVAQMKELSTIPLDNVTNILLFGGYIFMSATTAYKTYYEGSSMQAFIRGKNEHFGFSAPENGVGGSITEQPPVQ